MPRFARHALARIPVALTILVALLTFAPDNIGAQTYPSCGSWRQVASERYGGYRDALLDVTAISNQDVWAVGGSLPYATITQHWDGNKWHLVPSPSPGVDVNTLTSAYAVASNDVWAVGYEGVIGAERNLVLHWDGTSWQEIKAPSFGPQSFLYGVSSDSTPYIWAVGSVYQSCTIDGICHSTTFAMHWNGSTWVPTTTPSPSAGTNDLESVAVISKNDVWAVGARSITSLIGTVAQTLTLHWSGHSWEMVPSPNIGSLHNHLFHVAAVAANDVWAVGYQNGATLIEHWDGTNWSIVPSPNAPSPFGLNMLTNLAVKDANDIYAVGWYLPAASVQQLDQSRLSVADLAAFVSQSESQPLVLHWNGIEWSIIETPAVSSPNALYGVSVTKDPDRSVIAVGTFYSRPDNAMLPLNLHLGPHCQSYLPFLPR